MFCSGWTLSGADQLGSFFLSASELGAAIAPRMNAVRNAKRWTSSQCGQLSDSACGHSSRITRGSLRTSYSTSKPVVPQVKCSRVNVRACRFFQGDRGSGMAGRLGWRRARAERAVVGSGFCAATISATTDRGPIEALGLPA